MAWNNVFTSDFDSETTGAAPAGYAAGNWIVAVPGLNGSVKKITGSNTISKSFAGWNKVRFSFRFLTGGSTAVRNLRAMVNRQSTIPSSNDSACLLVFESGGQIQISFDTVKPVVSSANLQTWLANTEYLVTVELDCIEKTYNVNINGTDYTRSGLQYNFQRVNVSDDIGYLLFDSAGSSGGLDDITIDDYVPTNAVEILDPTSYRLYQRNGSNYSNITISGRYSGSPAAIEARWNGGAWTTISTSPTLGKFSGTLLNQAMGQADFECRVVGDAGYTWTSNYVSIGDLFWCSGQSNMSGRLTNNQVYTHATLKACLWKNNLTWAELSDPYDVSTGENDTLADPATGSYIPLLATLRMAYNNVPVAFVPVNLGGTSSLVWQPGTIHTDRTTHYGSMVYRMNKLGNVGRLVIWHQGESDGQTAVPAATYVSRMSTIIDTLIADTGLRLMNCKLQTCSGIPDADELEIRNGIQTLWDTKSIKGPDFVAIDTAPDPFHPTTDAKGLLMAQGWEAAIEAWEATSISGNFGMGPFGVNSFNFEPFGSRRFRM